MRSNTTIAWKDGVLACDKQGTYYNQQCKVTYKAIVDDQGEHDRIFAITGDVARGLLFIDSIVNDDKPSKRPKLKGTVVVEFDRKTGKLGLWQHHLVCLPVEDKYWAEGSGGQIALGAMAAGATAVEAIKIAAKHDSYTGGGVQSWSKR